MVVESVQVAESKQKGEVVMSLASILYVGLVWGAYKLGHFNASRPGEAWDRVARAWFWLCDWLKTGH